MKHLPPLSMMVRRGSFAALLVAGFATGALAQNNALRLGPTNTTTYVTFGNPGTCNGGTNNGGACTVASACPGGGTCGLGLAQFTRDPGIAPYLAIGNFRRQFQYGAGERRQRGQIIAAGK